MHNNRYKYIDITKGILILIVIFHHISFASIEMHIEGSLTWNFKLLPLYASWFMPAFFIVTGYCSNFDKTFKEFLISNLKTLLWPAITSFIITAFYGIVLFHNVSTFIEACETIPIRGFNWFLMALFISKILFWILRRIISNEFALGCTIIFVSIIAILFNDINLLGGNWFHHRHALYLTLFLYIGYLTKEKNLMQRKYLVIASFIFIITVFVCMKMYGVTPGIAGLWINFSVTNVPLHFVLALTGTSIIILISMIISRCRILEQIGKDSLIYYIFHIDVIRTIIGIICQYIVTPINVISILTADLIIIFFTVIICYIIAYTFNNTKINKLVKL